MLDNLHSVRGLRVGRSHVLMVEISGSRFLIYEVIRRSERDVLLCEFGVCQ
jgi:hypothetical protein